MPIAQLPQRVQSAARESAQEWKSRVGSLKGTEKWTRPLAVGSLIAGAILLARGKRRAGLAASATGAAIALLEDPEHATAVWKRIPGYIQGAKRMLAQAEGFIEDLGKEGSKLRAFLEKGPHR
jgi:hypothetical protein